MTKEEAIKYLQQLYPNGGHCWLDEQRIEAIGMAIKALQEDPISEELEEEIQKTIYNHFFDLDGIAIAGTSVYATVDDMVYIAKHFAQWQKEQMMSKAIDGKVLINGMGNPILHLWDKGKHLIDKKVKVIFVKEE